MNDLLIDRLTVVQYLALLHALNKAEKPFRRSDLRSVSPCTWLRAAAHDLSGTKGNVQVIG